MNEETEFDYENGKIMTFVSLQLKLSFIMNFR